MTRSKIFLGVTTAALAMTGVSVVKRTGIPIIRFYVTSNGTACHAIPAICNPVLGVVTCLGIYTNGSPIHTIAYGVLFTQGGSANVVVTYDKCKRKMTYDGSL